MIDLKKASIALGIASVFGGIAVAAGSKNPTNFVYGTLGISFVASCLLGGLKIFQEFCRSITKEDEKYI